MKYLITGAAGFVGTNLTKRLLENGDDVVAVDSPTRPGSERNLESLKSAFPAMRFYVREIYRERPDQVLYFAPQVAVTSSTESPLRGFRINAEGTLSAANAARNIGAPVIYTTTNKVYGDNANSVPIIEPPSRYDFAGAMKGEGISESFPIDADHHTPDGISKLVGEFYVCEFSGIARCSCMPVRHC